MTQAEITRHLRCIEIVTTAVSMMISLGASEQQISEILQWAATGHWPRDIVANLIANATQEAEMAARAKAQSLNGAHGHQ